jgi:hypothetical protein
LEPCARAANIAAMQVIIPRTAPRGPSRWSITLGAAVGSVLLVGGLVVAYLAFGTPFIARFTPTGRPDTQEMLAGMLAWSFALIAPSAFVIAGAARIAAVYERVQAARPPQTHAGRRAASLGDEYVAAARVRLPDGRIVPELVLGPFGAAVIEELPSPTMTRYRGDAWEIRTSHNKWIPLENPLERAARDAERVRRWFEQDDNDFVVKVYAAVVAPDTTLPRTPTCAVITDDQIPAWLASLPVQRSLTPKRRERLVELVSER